MNKRELEKILDMAKDYFISDSSIIEYYNQYAEVLGLSKVYLDEGPEDKCKPSQSPEDAPESIISKDGYDHLGFYSIASEGQFRGPQEISVAEAARQNRFKRLRKMNPITYKSFDNIRCSG